MSLLVLTNFWFYIRFSLLYFHIVNQPGWLLCSCGDVELKKVFNDGATYWTGRPCPMWNKNLRSALVLSCHIPGWIGWFLLFCGSAAKGSVEGQKMDFSILVVCYETLSLAGANVQWCWWIFNDCSQFQNFTYRCFNFLSETSRAQIWPPTKMLQMRFALKFVWRVIRGSPSAPSSSCPSPHFPCNYLNLSLSSVKRNRERDTRYARYESSLNCRIYTMLRIWKATFSSNFKTKAVKYKAEVIIKKHKPKDLPNF